VSVTPHDWRPTATPDTLRRRAGALATLRAFFAERGIMEIETPLIVSHPVSDPQLANVGCALAVRPGEPYWLHTSPEYHMKRALAAGAPDIYQVCRAFRDGEIGPRHLPEFTLVEWYRRGADYAEFMAETTALVAAVAGNLGRAPGAPSRCTYRELFLRHAGVDPLAASIEDIRECARARVPGAGDPALAGSLGPDREAWLDLLLVGVIEPALRDAGLVVVDGYPAAQAALARLDPADPRVARRFEVYLDGLELANGFHELADAGEQRRRFEADRRRRAERGLPDAPPDEAFLAALTAGLPDCCGVALGFDRLLMACLGLGDIAEAVSFAPPEPR
jgi:lysyl-tRNA synthetase class 2